MHIFHQFCYRWLHSGTSSAADSLLHKIQRCILGEKQRWLHFVTFSLPESWLFPLSLLCELTLCAAGSSPAWSAFTLPAGRVADAAVSTATGLVTSRPIETSWACCQEISKQYHYLPMNSADQKWNLQCLIGSCSQLICTGHSLRLQSGPIQPAGQEQAPLMWSQLPPFRHKHFSWQSRP